MATPTLFGVVGVLQPGDDLANQGLQDRQWQALSGQAIGRGGEASADQSGQVGHGGVAVEHLEDEDLDRNDGVEQARAPRVPGFSADLGDVFFREYASQIGLDLPQGVGDTRHPWPPVCGVEVDNNTNIMPRGHNLRKAHNSCNNKGLWHNLMPFGTGTSPDGLFPCLNHIELGASPLFQRTAGRAGRVRRDSRPPTQCAPRVRTPVA